MTTTRVIVLAMLLQLGVAQVVNVKIPPPPAFKISFKAAATTTGTTTVTPWDSSSPTCLNGWPLFKQSSDLIANLPWLQYFGTVYGAIPTAEAFPLCVGSLWVFYDNVLASAGVTDIPKSVGTCPTDPTEEGQRYMVNNLLSSPGTSWSWHPYGSHGYPPLAQHSWAEVQHEADPFGDEHFGAWLTYAPGSGIYFYIGATMSFPDHQDAYNFFKVPTGVKHPNEDMSKLCAAAGVDSLQFLAHRDPIKYKRCDTAHTGKAGLEYMNIDIVACKLTGTYPCTTSKGAPDVIKAGWGGSRPCVCDNSMPTKTNPTFLNCRGVPTAEPFATTPDSSMVLI